ncbi:MAG TPA: 5-(carboxyamino)imidazole ribonucleotide mutase [Candidatus Brocadiia bacterium]|nr:5-(carboxyamino)imidazole ribonucleotide mutase [Candidatus Brocadiia bacterium]
MAHKVAIIMGSDSDLPIVEPALDILKEFGIEHALRVISAHRSPQVAHDFAINAESCGFEVIIAVAGGAAHLGGVIASMTPLPVIGVPAPTNLAGGLDSLLSIVQMPSGVPVATMAVGEAGARNAAVLAAQIIGVSDPKVRQAVKDYKRSLAEKVAKKDAGLSSRGSVGF